MIAANVLMNRIESGHIRVLNIHLNSATDVVCVNYFNFIILTAANQMSVCQGIRHNQTISHCVDIAAWQRSLLIL